MNRRRARMIALRTAANWIQTNIEAGCVSNAWATEGEDVDGPEVGKIETEMIEIADRLRQRAANLNDAGSP